MVKGYLLSFLLILGAIGQFSAARLGQHCKEDSDCRDEKHLLATCHTFMKRCMCPASEKVSTDGESCVSRHEDGNIVIGQQKEKTMASPKKIPDSKSFKEFLVEATIKQAILNHALNNDKKIEVLRNKKALNKEVENIIMEAITKSKTANKHDYKIIVKAVKESLKEFELAESSIQKAVMKSIKLVSEEMQKKRLNKDLNKSVMIVLMITGLMMIAVPITVVYVKKIKERKFAQGMLNRMQQYSERTTTTNDDQGNFVADQYIEQTKDENVLNPKFLSAP